jgi:hypothetical protein
MGVNKQALSLGPRLKFSTETNLWTKGLFVLAYRLYNLDYNLNYIIQIIIYM